MEHRGSDVESVGSQEDARQAPIGFNPLLFSIPPNMLLQRAGGEEVVGEAFGDLSDEDESDEDIENVDEGACDEDIENIYEGADGAIERQ